MEGDYTNYVPINVIADFAAITNCLELGSQRSS
jgi:hypothetical protein